MCRYSVKAHSGHFTVRQEGTGDILTFEFGDYLDKTQAQTDARRVAYALNHAYESGIERGAREQRDYNSAVHGNAPEVKVGPANDGSYRHMINGVVCSERFANAASAREAAKQHLRGESER